MIKELWLPRELYVYIYIYIYSNTLGCSYLQGNILVHDILIKIK